MNKILLKYNDILDMYKSEYHGVIALSNYKNWFPLKSSPKLSGIVADLMGDGHLQDMPKGRLDYTSKSTRELKRFNKEIFFLFGISGKIRECKTNKYGTKNLGINNRALARVLKAIGVPAGSKVLQPFPIPNWVLKDKKNFSIFINRLFSCESCVDLWSKCVEIRMHKSLEFIEDGIDFFNVIKYYLNKYFKIRTTNPFLTGSENIRKDGIKTKGIRLKIKNKDSLKKFKKYIGIEDKDKTKRLNKIIK